MDKNIIISVDNLYQPVRLDRYLRKIGYNFTQGLFEKKIRSGHITLNDKRAVSKIRLKNGDKIAINEALVEEFNSISRESKIFSLGAKILAKKILNSYLLLETEEFIAINKPEGVAVQGGSKITLSIDDSLQFLNATEGTEYKLVHRLDKATSGVMLLAKNGENAAKLTKAFEDRLIKKTYISISAPIPKNQNGTIDCYIGKGSGSDQSNNTGYQKTELQSRVLGKRAISEYRILQKSLSGEYAVIEFRPITGRMHQIRFHSSYINSPILGDVKYGGFQSNRLYLHAKSLYLSSEVLGKEYKIEADIDVRFKTMLEELF